MFRNIIILFFSIVLICGCGGVYEYKVPEVQDICITHKLPGTVSFTVSAEECYHHDIGVNHYSIFVKDAVEKQCEKSLADTFEGGLVPKNGDVHIMITALNTSAFPITNIINDIRLFFRIEIFDKEMKLQKTAVLYGFGTAKDGNYALKFAVGNMYYQILPLLEELFIR